MVRRTGTQTVTASASAAISWGQSAISDSTYYSWSSGTNLNILQTGLYLCWFGITADADWPASSAGYIDWAPQVSGSGNASTLMMQPFGAHTNVDVFSPSFAPSGDVWTTAFLQISNPTSHLTGVVENETSSSFVVGVNSIMFVYRLCDYMDFA